MYANAINYMKNLVSKFYKKRPKIVNNQIITISLIYILIPKSEKQYKPHVIINK